MQYAFVLHTSYFLVKDTDSSNHLSNGGSLDSFISQRSGVPASSIPDPSLTKAERIRLFRFRQSGAIHLLKLDEIIAIFRDITNGLAFLHKKNILHLDMKSENVLLHWEEDELL